MDDGRGDGGGDPPLRWAVLLRAIERHLDRPARGDDLAGDACLSRFHFQRVFRRAVGETPGGLRRRLLLERAAHDLRATDADVTVIAFEADYRSLEGFSRAFKAAFGLSPSAYRRAARRVRDLPGPSGVHYDPATRGARLHTLGGRRNMDLTDRLIESDFAAKRRLLACAKLLSDAQLDAPLAFRHNLMPFAEPPRTIRQSLEYLLGGGQNNGWIVAMMDRVGWKSVDPAYRAVTGDTVNAMARRLDGFERDYRAFVNHVRAENLWDREWVDDTCAQMETFAVGMVIEASLTWGIASRMVLERLFEQMGFDLRQA